MDLMRVAIAVAFSVLTAGTALAAPVVTTPVIPGGITSGTSITCIPLNTGKKAAEITIDIFDASTGNLVGTSGKLTLNPGRVFALGVGYTASYCRVTGLAAKKVTVSYVLTSAAGNLLMSVTAP